MNHRQDSFLSLTCTTAGPNMEATLLSWNAPFENSLCQFTGQRPAVASQSRHNRQKATLCKIFYVFLKISGVFPFLFFYVSAILAHIYILKSFDRKEQPTSMSQTESGWLYHRRGAFHKSLHGEVRTLQSSQPNSITSD